MTDQPQGGGWWVASDGKWYPPEQHPSYQPQQFTPTPPGKTPNRTGLIVAGVVAVVALIAVAAFALGGGDDDDKAVASSDVRTEESEPSDATDETETSDDSSPSATSGTVADGRGGYTLTFPEPWRGVAIGENEPLDDVARRAVPDDRSKQRAIEQGLELLPRGVSLFAFDNEFGTFLTNLNALRVPGNLSLDQYEDEAPDQFESLGGEVLDVSRFDAGELESVRIEYTLGMAGQTIHGLQFGIIIEDQAYAFSFSTTEADRYDEFDSIMVSLAILR